MQYSLIILPEAEEDIKDAYNWYEDRRIGLGYDFILSLEAGFEQILRDPFVYALEYKETRKHLIKRFPYKIIYFIADKKVIILAVLHGKRNPDIIKDRA